MEIGSTCNREVYRLRGSDIAKKLKKIVGLLNKTPCPQYSCKNNPPKFYKLLIYIK